MHSQRSDHELRKASAPAWRTGEAGTGAGAAEAGGARIVESCIRKKATMDRPGALSNFNARTRKGRSDDPKPLPVPHKRNLLASLNLLEKISKKTPRP